MQITYYPAGSKPASQFLLTQVQNQDCVATQLDKLPIELLEMIMDGLSDLKDLHSLVAVYKRAYCLFSHDPKRILFDTLRKSHNQIQSLLLTTLLAQHLQSPGRRRPDQAHQVLDPEKIDSLLTQLYEKEDQDIQDRLLILIRNMGPYSLLREAAWAIRNITKAEKSLVTTMLSKANTEIERAMDIRQRRHTARLRAKTKGVRSDANYLAAFSAIPDRRQEHLYECDWLPIEDQPPSAKEPDELWTFEYAAHEHRVIKWGEYRYGSNSRTPTEEEASDPMPIKTLRIPDDAPNAGWEFLERKGEAIGNCQESPYRNTRRRALGCFIDWGYCIWDFQRMKAWHLIDDLQNGIEAEVDWWTDGGDRKEACEHCDYRWGLNCG
ncbi:MAG: hypothetical protein Q9168_000130 [Polycauliona sp. 1 TL-2023]